MRRDDHVAVARRFERNLARAEAFIASLPAGERFWEWAVVLRFYVVLHYMDAWLVDRTGFVPDNHVERNKAVRRWTQHWPRYSTLLGKSMEARYSGTQFSDAASESNRANYETLRAQLLRDLGVTDEAPRG